MKLENVLLLIPDTTNVSIVDAENGNYLSLLDGKDSIPVIYNDCEVASIHPTNDSFVISIVNNWIPTEKFNHMIEAFECDFNLAVDGEKDMQEIQDCIDQKDPKMLKDIELLQELSYLLRYGKAKIVIQGGSY